jgi:hypothetical protein
MIGRGRATPMILSLRMTTKVEINSRVMTSRLSMPRARSTADAAASCAAA